MGLWENTPQRAFCEAAAAGGAGGCPPDQVEASSQGSGTAGGRCTPSWGSRTRPARPIVDGKGSALRRTTVLRRHGSNTRFGVLAVHRTDRSTPTAGTPSPSWEWISKRVWEESQDFVRCVMPRARISSILLPGDSQGQGRGQRASPPGPPGVEEVSERQDALQDRSLSSWDRT